MDCGVDQIVLKDGLQLGNALTVAGLIFSFCAHDFIWFSFDYRQYILCIFQLTTECGLVSMAVCTHLEDRNTIDMS